MTVATYIKLFTSNTLMKIRTTYIIKSYKIFINIVAIDCFNFSEQWPNLGPRDLMGADRESRTALCANNISEARIIGDCILVYFHLFRPHTMAAI